MNKIVVCETVSAEHSEKFGRAIRTLNDLSYWFTPWATDEYYANPLKAQELALADRKVREAIGALQAYSKAYRTVQDE